MFLLFGILLLLHCKKVEWGGRAGVTTKHKFCVNSRELSIKFHLVPYLVCLFIEISFLVIQSEVFYNILVSLQTVGDVTNLIILKVNRIDSARRANISLI